MKKIKIAVAGYGNIGRFAIDAIMEGKDMEFVGLIRRSIKNVHYPYENIKVVTDVQDLEKPDVVILAVPSNEVEKESEKYLEMGIHTIDCFDKHEEIYNLKKSLDQKAKANNRVAVVSAGWDPGTDSIIRTLLEIKAPKGITYTNFGPGMSMGHSVFVRSISGVKDALSLTIPLGTGIHRRIVYVVLEKGVDLKEIKETMKKSPYFSNDETHVIETEDIHSLQDVGHGVTIERKGSSGVTHNQTFQFDMRINNPALTAQIMVSAARASMKQQAGAYTMIEIPLIDFLYGETEEIIKRLV